MVKPARYCGFYITIIPEEQGPKERKIENGKLIDQHRKEKGDPLASMMAIYDYLHKKHIEETNEIKMYQAQYRGE